MAVAVPGSCLMFASCLMMPGSDLIPFGPVAPGAPVALGNDMIGENCAWVVLLWGAGCG